MPRMSIAIGGEKVTYTISTQINTGILNAWKTRIRPDNPNVVTTGQVIDAMKDMLFEQWKTQAVITSIRSAETTAEQQYNTDKATVIGVQTVDI